MLPVSPPKITVPSRPGEFVVRSALRAVLDAADPADVVLVCAPAGYGKTLLLADWARSGEDVDTAWVSLDHDDNDPRRLWSAVVAALSACPSVPSEGLLHRPWHWRPDNQPEMLAELVDDLQALPRPVRLVLDDVHRITDPEALRGLGMLTRNRPPNLQPVLSGRVDPPLSLSRLRLMEELREIRTGDMLFTEGETRELIERSGLDLSRAQLAVLHRETGGWAAALRLAALGLASTSDPDAFLARFADSDRSVQDYLAEEILSGMPEDSRDFLRAISVSDPVPFRLAAELSGRQDAGTLLDALEHRTSLVSSAGRVRDVYRVQQLLRTYQLADLRRHAPLRTAELHTVAARWWADHDHAAPALHHAALSSDRGLLGDTVHRFALPLVLAGDHAPLRGALATVGPEATAADPWLALVSALAHLEAGDTQAACDDVRRARGSWPSRPGTALVVLRTVAEQLCAGIPGMEPPAPLAEIEDLPDDPPLEALAHLARGTAALGDGDMAGACDELEAALVLCRRHGFAYLDMQCRVLLGCVAATAGDVPSMEAATGEAIATADRHGWPDSTWSLAARSMLAHAALQRADFQRAADIAAEGLRSVHLPSYSLWRYMLRVAHGAAVFDSGERAAGMGELQTARLMFGDEPTSPELCAGAAMLEFRAALLLGHSAAAGTAYGWLADRTAANAELLLMRALTATSVSGPETARATIRPVLNGSVPVLLPQTVVEAWLFECSLAITAGERPAARQALQNALEVAEPLDSLRPFTQATARVRELLARQHGSFGP
ncbi:MAG: AAA family ATPase, partial [Pseudonocardia sediminis]